MVWRTVPQQCGAHRAVELYHHCGYRNGGGDRHRHHGRDRGGALPLPGKAHFQGLAGAPLAFPQLLLGIVLLLWFSVLGRWFGFNTGIVTAIIGHIVYIAPFAMVIVAVQVYNFDPVLEDAARDCGATSWEVYAM